MTINFFHGLTDTVRSQFDFKDYPCPQFTTLYAHSYDYFFYSVLCSGLRLTNISLFNSGLVFCFVFLVYFFLIVVFLVVSTSTNHFLESHPQNNMSCVEWDSHC